jgi:hypothetical protein
MKRPRLRFTVRRLMIAVAIVAVSISAISWVVEMRTRSTAYERRAIEFAGSTARGGSGFVTKDGRWVSKYDDENDWLRDAWACKMAKRYWRLSDYPWLPVEPALPPPERLDNPRPAIDLPAELDHTDCWNRESRPPAWTFLWTWRW